VFSKISRYRNEPDVTSVDAAGRTLRSKQVPLVRVARGQFLHTLTDDDRPDRLAYKFYKQPRKWWRICDGNPEFMSPQALFGTGTTLDVRVPVSATGTPPWSSAQAALLAELGVSDVRVLEEVELVPEQQLVGAELVTVLVGEIIEGAGLEVGEPQLVGRSGKPIVIPPDPAGARR
jgi:hypothetical protein